jgi:hypothetical protein
MHQMRISITYISSVMFRPTKLVIRNVTCMTVNRIECHEMEPNTSSDRAMYEGDNPLLQRARNLEDSRLDPYEVDLL